MAFVPQNFVDKVGPVVKAAFLNGVDILANSIFGSATTNAQARTNLMVDAPLEIANGGTAARTAVAARAALTTDNPLEVANGGTAARTAAAARTSLTSDLPLEVVNGGTAARTTAAARASLCSDLPLEVVNGGTGSRTLAGITGPLTGLTGVGPAMTFSGNDTISRGVPIIRYVTVNENRTSNTTPTNSAFLALALTSAQTYAFRFYLAFGQAASAGGGVAFGFNHSAGFTGSGYTVYNQAGLAIPPFATTLFAQSTPGACNQISQASFATVNAQSIAGSGMITISVVGTFALAFAQNASNANATTLLPGSWLELVPMA